MEPIIVALSIGFVTWLYFNTNPLKHTWHFMIRRFISWFPLGMSYAFLYMGRYNLNVAKNALGAGMNKESFGLVFGIGTVVYGFSFLVVGPLVDKIGGKKGIIIATVGSSLANIILGVVTYLFLTNKLAMNLTVMYATIYSLNMFFQSFGSVSINKVKAYWFHVRERGTFGAIFGTLISAGIYFAFDWGQALVDASKKTAGASSTPLHKILNNVFAIDRGPTDATWLVFFIPAMILLAWTALDTWLIKDTPAHAKLEDFDTHDASSGEMHINFSFMQILKKVFTNPVMIIISLVELTTGVIRNGVLQWYFIFAKEVKQPGAEYFLLHWGFLLFLTGVIASFAGGILSDKYFHSRRGPPTAIFYSMTLVFLIIMTFTLKTNPIVVGICAVAICMASIGVHALMSGTAASDFGGRKVTATAAGITDGFVYLGSGIQSVSLGFLTTKDWIWWPVFLLPFAVIGLLFTLRMWKDLPAATKSYLLNVEKVDPHNKAKSTLLSSEELLT